MSIHSPTFMPDARAASAVLRLGFLTPHNPFDVTAFSGSAHFAHAALSRVPGVALTVMGPHRPPRSWDRVTAKFGQRAPAPRPGTVATDDLDVVLGLVATPLLDALPGDVPFLHVTDATPAFLEALYGRDIAAPVHATERRVAARAARVIYSSHEMAARAPSDLGLPGLAAATVPFGVNFDAPPGMRLRPPAPDRLELLTVISDWTRKGGAIAVETLARLRARGVDAHLTIVGDAPASVRAPGVTCAGWLRKSRPAEAARLAALYARADVFVLPTRADCTPMVLAEAMAHGLPCVATRVGGTGTLVTPATGTLLPLEAGPDDWAEAIRDIAAPATWAMMSEAAQDRATTCLAWDAWAREVTALARRAMPRPQRRHAA